MLSLSLVHRAISAFSGSPRCGSWASLVEAAPSVVLEDWRVVVLIRSKLKDNPEPGLVVRVAVFLHP